LNYRIFDLSKADKPNTALRSRQRNNLKKMIDVVNLRLRGKKFHGVYILDTIPFEIQSIKGVCAFSWQGNELGFIDAEGKDLGVVFPQSGEWSQSYHGDLRYKLTQVERERLRARLEPIATLNKESFSLIKNRFLPNLA
jgi:hypothetical protein